MKWNAEAVAQLASLAGDGYDKVEIAKVFGCSPNAIRLQARRYGILLVPLKNPGHGTTELRGPFRAPRESSDDKLRARCAKLLPAMRAALRADIEADLAKTPRVSGGSS